MNNYIFDFENDITKVRKILTLYIGELIEKEKSREEVLKAISDKAGLDGEGNDDFSTAFGKAALAFFIGTFYVGNSIHKIKSSPNQIDITAVLGTEFLFAFSQLTGKEDINKREEVLKHHSFVSKYFLKLLELDFIELFPQNDYYQQGETNISKQQFLTRGDFASNEFFAYMLRQKDIQSIANFLDIQSQKYKTGFVSFVKNTLVEYKDIFEEKTNMIVENWIAKHTKNDNAKSIPQELMAIIPHNPSIPVVSIIAKKYREYAMYEHFERYDWVLPLYVYESKEELLKNIKEKVIDPAEQKSSTIMKQV